MRSQEVRRGFGKCVDLLNCVDVVRNGLSTVSHRLSDPSIYARAAAQSSSSRSSSQPPTINIGLAISGGVDSMALAAACAAMTDHMSNIQRRGFDANYKFRFKAFIVDHQARLNSGVESHSVAARIQEMGIPAYVLKIQWPDHENPMQMSNFETRARRYRYRLLGQACCEHQIDILCTAHHKDDASETALMRIATGRAHNGIVGLRQESGIPECEGLYLNQGRMTRSAREAQHIDHTGVSSAINARAQAVANRQNHLRKRQKSMNGCYTIASSRTLLFRPLLTIPKKQLVSFCERHKIQWFEDTTNSEPTLTLRNTIRHLLSSSVLPVALRSERLQRLLTSRRIFERNVSVNKKARLANGQIAEFCPESGVVRIRFRKRPEAFSPEVQRADEQVLLAMCRAVGKEGTETRDVARALQFMTTSSSDGNHGEGESVFSTSNVLIQKHYKATMIGSIPESELENHEWWISRRPQSKSERVATRLDYPPAGSTASDKSLSDTSWQLFDDRFWIKVKNHSEHLLRLQTLYDLSHLNRSFSKDPKAQAQYRRIRKLVAPGIVAHSLPVIIQYGPLGTSSGRPIALPSLGLYLPGGECEVSWDIHYKGLDSVFAEREGTGLRVVTSQPQA